MYKSNKTYNPILQIAKSEYFFAIFGEILFEAAIIIISIMIVRENQGVISVGYQNFKTAIYCPVRDVVRIADNPQFERDFAFIEKHIKLDKVYLETYRGGRFLSRDQMLKVKEYFSRKGIKTSGGITPDASGDWEFKSLCYTNPEHFEKLRQVVQFTAELFDEIIFDDFFFTNCKCESCIQAKGGRSWSEFRTELLRQAAEMVIKTAKQANPRIHMIIKYPNWYDEYQNTGYNLQDVPQLFDQVYTGTETRDPRYTQQDLQRYLGYFLMRYLENIKPGANGGGWFDTYDCMYNLGSYAEQCYATLFAKAREVTLFCMNSLLYRDNIFVPIAGYVFERVDEFLGKLGNPQGIACYKPYHSWGENYLFGYLGMLGLPLEPQPQFPAGREIVFLTESAQKDLLIVNKIKEQLMAGKKVVITSGLLKALAERGITDIAEIRATDRKVLVDKFAYPMYECSFGNYYDAAVPIMIPQIEFATNDCVQLVVAFAENKNYPILLQVKYGLGVLYVLTIPDNHSELYHLPPAVIDRIRRTITADQPIRLEGPAQIGLFVYDNDTFIVESFLPYHADCQIVIKRQGVELVDLSSNLAVAGNDSEDGSRFQLKLAPATYKVFRYQAKS